MPKTPKTHTRDGVSYVYEDEGIELTQNVPIDPITPVNSLISEDYVKRVITSDMVSVTRAKGKIPIGDPNNDNKISLDWVGLTEGATYLIDASYTTKGIIEIADDNEVYAGTDTSRAVTPAGLKKGIQYYVLNSDFIRAKSNTSATASDGNYGVTQITNFLLSYGQPGYDLYATTSKAIVEYINGRLTTSTIDFISNSSLNSIVGSAAKTQNTNGTECNKDSVLSQDTTFTTKAINGYQLYNYIANKDLIFNVNNQTMGGIIFRTKGENTDPVTINELGRMYVEASSGNFNLKVGSGKSVTIGQYTGSTSSKKTTLTGSAVSNRVITLLDSTGNTKFPGTVSMNKLKLTNTDGTARTVGNVTTPVYIDTNGEIAVCNIGTVANATKATQDGAGNTITDTYLPLSGGKLIKSDGTKANLEVTGTITINGSHNSMINRGLKITGATQDYALAIQRTDILKGVAPTDNNKTVELVAFYGNNMDNANYKLGHIVDVVYKNTNTNRLELVAYNTSTPTNTDAAYIDLEVQNDGTKTLMTNSRIYFNYTGKPAPANGELVSLMDVKYKSADPNATSRILGGSIISVIGSDENGRNSSTTYNNYTVSFGSSDGGTNLNSGDQGRNQLIPRLNLTDTEDVLITTDGSVRIFPGLQKYSVEKNSDGSAYVNYHKYSGPMVISAATYGTNGGLVNVSGINNISSVSGTFSGDINVEGNILTKKTTITRGTAPTSNIYMNHVFKDKANNYLGAFETTYFTNKSSLTALYTYKTTEASGNYIGRIGVGCNTDGKVYTVAPTPAETSNDTNIATTAFVKTIAGKYLPLAGGTMSGSITLKNTNVTRGTEPKSAYTHSYLFKDSAGNLLGAYQSKYNKDMSSITAIYAYNTKLDSGSYIGRIGIGSDANGKVFTVAPTPVATDNSTKIATTAFVNSFFELVSAINEKQNKPKKGGYLKFGNGFIIEWAQVSANSTWTFPVPVSTVFYAGWQPIFGNGSGKHVLMYEWAIWELTNSTMVIHETDEHYDTVKAFIMGKV